MTDVPRVEDAALQWAGTAEAEHDAEPTWDEFADPDDGLATRKPLSPTLRAGRAIAILVLIAALLAYLVAPFTRSVQVQRFLRMIPRTGVQPLPTSPQHETRRLHA